MCTFITLIAATNDLERVNAILSTRDRRGHVRRAERVDTPALRVLLTAEEKEFVVSRATCDCGTFLGHAVKGTDEPATERAADIARYRRRGWSDARIMRAIADKERTEEHSPRRAPNEDAAYWIELLTALAVGLGLKRVGLMHHFYRSGPGQEPAMAARQDAGRIEDAALILPGMADAVIHDFDITAAGR